MRGGRGSCLSSARGDRGKGREGALRFCLERKRKRAFPCELWPRTGAAVDFGQPLGPRRRQRGALWRSRAAGDAAVRCPERPSLPAAESRVWKGAELLLTARWKAVLWGNNPSLVALIQRTLKHRPWWTARENWEEHYEAELRLRALLTAEAAPSLSGRCDIHTKSCVVSKGTFRFI